MKKFFYLSVFMFLSFTNLLKINAQTGIVVYSKDTLCFNTNSMISILHEDSDINTTTLVCQDTIITRKISEIDSISLNRIPKCLILKENIGDWSEMKICYDGTVAMTKLNNDGFPTEIDMMCPDDSIGAIISKIYFDESAYPVEINMNYCRCLFDWISGNMANITIAYSDSLSVKYDSIQFQIDANARLISRRVPNVDEKPWTTRLGGAIEMLGGIAGVGVGGVMIFGSGAAEIFSAGSSTPISIPSIAIGAYTVRGGIMSIRRGFINAFTDYYETGWDPIRGTLSSQAATQTFEKGVVPLIPDKYFSYLADNKYNTTNAGWASFFAQLLGQAVSNIGRPFTWFDLFQAVQENVKTGIVYDKSTNFAIIRGYIGPYILESPSGRFDTEYGIIVYSTTDEKDRHIMKENNGNGGLIEYRFNNLKPGTTYKYCTYYIDKTNGCSALGEIKEFRTLSVPVAQIEQISAESTGLGKVRFKANVKLNELDKAIEGTVAYGFGIYRDGERVYEYTIDSFDEVKEIEIDCESSNLTIDLDNYEASTEGHWTIAISVQYDYETAHFITFFTDEMQDVILTYDKKPKAVTGEVLSVETTSAVVKCTYEGCFFWGIPCGIEYGYDDNIESVLVTADYDGEQEIHLTDLTPDKTYSYRAYYEINGKREYGVPNTFTTNGIISNDIRVKTLEIIKGMPEYFVAYGKLDNFEEDLDGNSYEYGISYKVKGTTNSRIYVKTSYFIDKPNRIFEVWLPLDKDTEYVYQAYIKIDGKYVYGEEKSYKTRDYHTPVAITGEVIAKTETSFTVECTFKYIWDMVDYTYGYYKTLDDDYWWKYYYSQVGCGVACWIYVDTFDGVNERGHSFNFNKALYWIDLSIIDIENKPQSITVDLNEYFSEYLSRGEKIRKYEIRYRAYFTSLFTENEEKDNYDDYTGSSYSWYGVEKEFNFTK